MAGAQVVSGLSGRRRQGGRCEERACPAARIIEDSFSSPFLLHSMDGHLDFLHPKKHGNFF